MDILLRTSEARHGLRRAREVVAALLLTLLGLLTAGGGAAASASPVALGAYIPHADENPALIDSFAQQVGWNPAIVVQFKTFDQAPVYYPQLDAIRNHGAIPMITWEPQTSSEGRIDLSNIARGHYDGYIGDVARAAANWEHPLMIRIAQEMNGAWYPWSPAHGNSARSFVHAWRHIVRVFRREGASNVKWVWTPYVKTDGNLSFARFYPGDRYVDWAGFDAYNWGGSFAWKSFRTLVARSYRRLLRLTSRPLMIGEVGCGEIGGSKSRWLRLMLHRNVPRMTHIRAVVWFDDTDPKGDLRVDTSTSALNAFRRWTSAPLYSSSRTHVLRTPERLPRGSDRLARWLAR